MTGSNRDDERARIILALRSDYSSIVQSTYNGGIEFDFELAADSVLDAIYGSDQTYETAIEGRFHDAEDSETNISPAQPSYGHHD